AGARVCVPEGERDLFDNVEAHWADPARRWHLYDDHPFPPVRTTSVPVAQSYANGDTFLHGDTRVTVLHTPGHTNGSVSYLVDDDGRRVAFVGDVLCEGGRLWDIHSLQKGEEGLTDYHGFLGARAELAESLERLRDAAPDVIVPSHGGIIQDPQGAIAALLERLEACYDQYASVSALRFYFPRMFTEFDGREDHMPIRDGMDPPSFLRHVGTSWIVVSDNREAYVMDCGSPRVLESLGEMREGGEIDSVTGLWITHYHDDHVDEIPAFQAAHDCVTRADGTVADVVTRPAAHRIPCISPSVARVDHVTAEGESWEWNEFRMTAYHFPGQTYYHGGLLAEGHGTRLFFAGDSFTPGGMDDYCAMNRNLLGRGRGYDRCLALLEELKPTHIFNCHVDAAFAFTDAQVLQMRENLRAREESFGDLCAWEHVNYGLDMHWVRCDPYEQRVAAGDAATVRVCVTNYSDGARVVGAQLDTPSGWSAPATASATIPAGADGSVPFRVRVPLGTPSGRYVVPADITYHGRPLGPIREAIVEVV
ncbi:MBL fold metallo-hydrolase, partial [Candidatus Poribacteria bacterium]|nr:MBL fold metallo-hydrolase [Candidatus Poribacteria bacterium]